MSSLADDSNAAFVPDSRVDQTNQAPKPTPARQTVPENAPGALLRDVAAGLFAQDPAEKPAQVQPLEFADQTQTQTSQTQTDQHFPKLRFYLAEGLVKCSCPDCSGVLVVHRMSWTVHCQKCGRSRPLSEQQRQEITVLLEHAQGRSQLSMVQRTDPPAPQVAAQHRPVGEQPTGLRQRLRDLQSGGRWRTWWREWLRDAPSWTISAFLHTLLVVLLALMFLSAEKQPEQGLNFLARSDELSDEDDLDRQEFQFEETPFDEVDQSPLPQLTPEQVPQIAEQALADQPQLELPIQPVPDPTVVIPQAAGFVEGTKEMFDGRKGTRRGQLARTSGGSPASESAVALGLKWLAKVQKEDGSWNLWDHGGRTVSPTAATGLAVLPFLGAGQTHQEGEYQQTVGRGLDWLKSKQLPDGDLRGRGSGTMYAHGICTLALCEAYAMTKDPSLREPAQKAIGFIVWAQSTGGGWRYKPGQKGDTSVLGWQLMALRSGQAAGLDVNRKVFRKISLFLDDVREPMSPDLGLPSGSFGYLYQRVPEPKPPTPTITAEALLCRMYLGASRDHEDIQTGVLMLTKEEFLPSTGRPKGRDLYSFYYWYYATQMMHHYGGREWTIWNNRMRDLLVSLQEKDGGEYHGSWGPDRAHSHAGGRIYNTAMALLTLEVYYRHLPLYKSSVFDEAAP